MRPERESRPHEGTGTRDAAKLSAPTITPWWPPCPEHDTDSCELPDCQFVAPPLVCPPQHAERLTAARVVWCAEHGCPLCFTDPLSGGAYCVDCELRTVAVIEHESPPADPWCVVHGIPDVSSYGEQCEACDALIRTGRMRGWTGRTGHDGPDCVHCSVCGKCKATKDVCRGCSRCSEHPLAPWNDAPCERPRWSRAYQQAFVFHEPDVWDPVTGRWDPLPEQAA